MAITHFIPEIWNASILEKLRNAQVYASCVNRNYEGDIRNAGDTVHITSVGDVTIGTYTRNTDLTAPETLTDSEQVLVIDQGNAFNFQLDDLDAAQALNGGALMSEATQSAAYGLRDKVDHFVSDLMVGAAKTGVSLVDATTATNVYDQLLVPASVALDEQNIPEEQRWIVVDPATYGKLRLDGRFIKVNESGSNALRNGVVGEAAGFSILKSNQAPTSSRTEASVTTASGAKTLTGTAGQFSQADIGASVTGTGVGASAKVVSVNADGSVATVDVNSSASAAVTVTLAGGKIAIAGSNIATTFAEQVLKTEAYRMERRFADALKGLHVFGGKVIRPEALVVASVKTS